MLSYFTCIASSLGESLMMPIQLHFSAVREWSKMFLLSHNSE